MKIKGPIRQESDGAAPLWYDANGQYISYEDITEILNEYAASSQSDIYDGGSK